MRWAKPLTGIELNRYSIKMAQILREKKEWRLIEWVHLPLSTEIFDFSYKNETIVEPGLFRDTIQEGLKSLEGRVSKIGLSIPNEIVKLSIHRFDELPQSIKKIERLIEWKEKDSLPFPLNKAKISFSPFQPKGRNGKTLCVAIGSHVVLKDIETNFKRMHIHPETIQPSAISLLNFYIDQLPMSGIIAFLGIFENSFCFFVFEDGQMTFYRGKRQPSSLVHLLQEIDMTIGLFLADYPEKKIETLYLEGKEGPYLDFEKEIKDDFDMDVILLEPRDDLLTDQSMDSPSKLISDYSTAISAASSLVF